VTHKIELSIEKYFPVTGSIQKKNAVRIQNKQLGLRTSGLLETKIKLEELRSKALDSG